MSTDIDKWLSRAGLMSRSDAAIAVANGRVWIDGVPAKSTESLVADGARVAVDGVNVLAAPRIVIALHKPAGVMSTHRDPRGRRTVYDLLSPELTWVAAVGRLDLDSEGLILLTNDPHLGWALTDPARGVQKIYHVTCRGQVSEAAVAELASGVMLVGATAPTRPAQVRVLARGALTTDLEIVLHEGKKRQIRRMVLAVNSRVRRLVRVQVGPIKLGNLAAAQSRQLRADEIDALAAAATYMLRERESAAVATFSAG